MSVALSSCVWRFGSLHEQAHVLDSFLQAPFTGTYTAQSGEVVGILKNMLDTFEANLAAAEKTEADQLAAFDKYMAELSKALKEMQEAYSNKQSQLGGNDGDLATKRGRSCSHVCVCMRVHSCVYSHPTPPNA